MPIEYCEYYSNASKCREWLQRHLPEEFEKRLKLTEGTTNADGQANGTVNKLSITIIHPL